MFQINIINLFYFPLDKLKGCKYGMRQNKQCQLNFRMYATQRSINYLQLYLVLLRM